MEIVFDFIIFFFLGSIGVYLIHGLRFWKRFRQRHVSLALFFFFALSWAVVFYGSFIEPRLLIVKQETVTLHEQPTQTLRAVVFSDLHAGPFKKIDWIQRVVSRVMALQPDIVFIAGDFIVNSAADVDSLSPLKQLSAPYGVYAVTGNHDYQAQASQEVIHTLEQAGIEVLENEVVNLEVNGQILRLAGVSDLWFEGDLARTVSGVREDDAVVLLVHNPDVMLDSASRKADLVLAAHTHGGQIRLPWIGSVPSLPTQLGRAYDKGWFTFDSTQLFITSGVGESGTRARLFIPPEIVVLNLSW